MTEEQSIIQAEKKILNMSYGYVEMAHRGFLMPLEELDILSPTHCQHLCPALLSLALATFVINWKVGTQGFVATFLYQY